MAWGCDADLRGNRGMTGLRARFSLALLCLTIAAPAHAEKRVALVIGNSTYKSARLENPGHDAELMAETLRGAGFTLVGGAAQLDLDGSKFRDAVKEFGKELQGADVGLFYYAGHGAQVRGLNYLIPIDATDVDLDMIDANAVLRQMQGAGSSLNIVILDACRNDPFGGFTIAGRASDTTRFRDWNTGGGLAEMTAPPGTLIAFAAQPNKVAQDGAGRDSPFTAALADAIRAPGLDLNATFSRIQAEVYDATHHQQTPYYVSIIIPTFYFTSPTGAQNVSARATPAPPAGSGPSEAERAWVFVKDTTNHEVLEDFIRRFGDTFYGTLARERLEELNKTAKKQEVSDTRPITDPALLKEISERLYELNFDPDMWDNGSVTESTRKAIREFEQLSGLPPTGLPTMGLLQRLRAAGGLKPWGAIVYGKDSNKWGMAWDEDSRKAALEHARASCGDAKSCPAEISFFGGQCGAFAYSGSGWAIVARDEVSKAKEAALGDCGKRGKSCQIIAAVCANGSDRASAAK
jgi:uncharacterized caspase-like protein